METPFPLSTAVEDVEKPKASMDGRRFTELWLQGDPWGILVDAKSKAVGAPNLKPIRSLESVQVARG